MSHASDPLITTVALEVTEGAESGVTVTVTLAAPPLLTVAFNGNWMPAWLN